MWLRCPTKEDALALRLPNLVVYSKFCSEILLLDGLRAASWLLRYADMPANHTFLGGSGLVIPKEAGESEDFFICSEAGKRHVCSSETDEATSLQRMLK